MIRKKQLLWLAAFVVGWGFDFFYWRKPLGISFSLHVMMAITALLFIARKENKGPTKKSLWILLPLVIFSLMTFFRQEPFTRTLNHALTLGLGTVFLLTFRGGSWSEYHLGEYLLGWLKLILNALILPIQLIINSDGDEVEVAGKAKGDSRTPLWKKAIPYLRGILITIPVLALFAALFSGADPIFANRLDEFITYLHLEKLPEYIARLVLIMIWTFLVAGLMLYALLKSEEESLIGEETTWPPRFLGFTEASIVLGNVNLLFFSFILIQFRYFFGGKSNISLQGYTYAEYARRGFGELLAAAFVSLLLFMVLSAITERKAKGQTVIFTVLTIALTLFVGIILFSSFQRLRLYENAYGFTRLRTYAHLCILWIGILFSGLLVLEILHQWRYFTFAGILAVLGFVLTLNAINVDAFITRHNFNRAAGEEQLDTNYLARLSNDAVPTLIRFADSGWIPPQQRKEIQVSLACQAAELRDQPSTWRGFLWSRYRAKKALFENKSLWKDYLTFQENDIWYVIIDGEKEYCKARSWD